MNAVFNFIKRPLVIFLIVVALAGIFVYFLFIKKSTQLPETVIAKRGTIMQEVSVTGKTKPAKNIDLAFEQNGKVKRVNVDVGDKVSSGQILVELDSSELYAQLLEAEANIQTQQAKLDELKKGTRPEELEVYETKIINAKTSLEDAKRNLIDKLQDAYTKSDDAVRNKVDQYFSNPRTLNPSLLFNCSAKVDLEAERVTVEYILVSWKSSLDKLTVSSDLGSYLDSAKSNLNQSKSFLEKNALALNSLSASTNLSQTTIDTYRSAVSTARTNVNTAITNLQIAEETLSSAESDVLLAEKNLALAKAGSVPEQITAQEAQVKKAEASADIIRVKIGKNILRSFINGIITKQEAKVGEIISANSIIVSVISVGGFSAEGGPASGWELEANVPEADIAKIKVGDPAKVTLDAFGSDKVFEAKVTKIDPGETIIEGVATYKTTLQFIKGNEGVKSGMTANIDILTAKKETVIVIPQRAVIAKDGDKFIRILNAGGAIEEIKVETGLRGSDGNIEIISGLNEGDKIIYGAY